MAFDQQLLEREKDCEEILKLFDPLLLETLAEAYAQSWRWGNADLTDSSNPSTESKSYEIDG